MNERIKDFGKQAYNAGTGIWPINSQMWYEVYNTTFAELIVRECMNVAVYKSDGMMFTADIAGHRAAGREIAAKMIKEHFGVEE